MGLGSSGQKSIQNATFSCSEYDTQEPLRSGIIRKAADVDNWRALGLRGTGPKRIGTGNLFGACDLTGKPLGQENHVATPTPYVATTTPTQAQAEILSVLKGP